MARFADPDPRHRPNRGWDHLRWGVIDPLLGRRRRAPPGPPAPGVAPDREAIHDPSSRPRLTWLGHASALVTLGGRSALIDPVFSRRIAGIYRRFGPPPPPPESLPRPVCALLTHNHFDHLDLPSLDRLPEDVPVVTPSGLGRWLSRRRPRPMLELGWWESAELDGLRVTLVPARHWSRRGIFDRNRVLWGGFVVEGGGSSVYHAGDSAWFDGFAEIGRRFPGLDAALLPIGAYAPAWYMERHHMNPEQAGEAFLSVGARLLVPVHWGAFQLTDEPLSEPVGRLRVWWEENAPGDGRRLAVLAIGETLALEAAGA